MATDFNNRVLDASALMMYVLRENTNPAEAQIALALLVGHLCQQNGIAVDAMMHVLRANVLQLLGDPVLLSRVNERIHTVGTGSVLLSEAPITEHHHEVGELLHKHKQPH